MATKKTTNKTVETKAIETKKVAKNEENRGTTQFQLYVTIQPLRTSNKVPTDNAVRRFALQ